MEETEKKKVVVDGAKDKEEREANEKRGENPANKLLGGSNFDALARELAAVAPTIAATGNYELFRSRAYLFSIGDGCGLSSYLKVFAELIASLGLRQTDKIGVIEQRLGSYDEGMGAFENVFNIISHGFQGVNLFSIDISEWIDKTESVYFKQFLRIVEKLSDGFVFVFRVPYIDKDVLRKVEYSLGDLLFIRTVTFPPLTREDIDSYAESAFASYRLKLDEKAKELFYARLAKERNDGKFYGMNTVIKVIKEIAYKKLLIGGGNVISARDMTEICEVENYFHSANDELDSLIAEKAAKRKLLSVVGKTEKRLKEGKKNFANIKLIGNAGTGKTTAARIMGKLLKERGALEKGALYEYTAENLLGRYAGETAPKIAGIVRDALGSVLFIDEIGAFADNAYGREAMIALKNLTDNYGDKFIIAVAGTAEDFQRLGEVCGEFVEALPFSLDFPDFDGKRLYEIFAAKVKNGYSYDDKLLAAAKKYFMSLSEEVLTGDGFSNARFACNLLSRTAAKAELRAELEGGDAIKLTEADFEFASREKDFAFDFPKKVRMGFNF